MTALTSTLSLLVISTFSQKIDKNILNVMEYREIGPTRQGGRYVDFGRCEMVIHPRENDLVVATHGRGIFITDISFLQELSQEVLEKDVHLFDIEPKVKWISNKNINYSSSNFRGESEPRGLVINYYLKNPMVQINIIYRLVCSYV